MESPKTELVDRRSLLALLRAARTIGLDTSGLESQTSSELVPGDAYARIVRTIFEHSDVALGVKLAAAYPVTDSGLWNYLLSSSQTVGAMLERARHFIRLSFRFTRLDLVRTANEVHVRCVHPTPSPFGSRPQEVCFFLGQWVSWLRYLTDGDLEPSVVKMRWAGPSSPEPLTAFFRCPIEFGATEDALILGDAALEMPLRVGAPELARVFEAHARRTLDQMTPARPFSATARDALDVALHEGDVRETTLARRLGVSVRTLRRRLAEESLTFRSLKDAAQLERAEHLLTQPGITIAEVASALGYANPANFHRAFRRWTETTPARWLVRRREA